MKEQLPGFILAGLYNKSLVQVENEMKHPAIDKALFEQPKNVYLGNYERKIIVLVNDSDNIYLGDEQLNFLTGILAACKHNLAHIALININEHHLDFYQLKKELQPEFLIAFGITALQIELPFAMPDYQVQEYSKCKIITAPALTTLNGQTPEAKAGKTKLWKSLQNMFNLQ
jgi:hypothetical protein